MAFTVCPCHFDLQIFKFDCPADEVLCDIFFGKALLAYGKIMQMLDYTTKSFVTFYLNASYYIGDCLIKNTITMLTFQFPDTALLCSPVQDISFYLAQAGVK